MFPRRSSIPVDESLKMALTLFHSVSERVPAYKHFLKTHGINHRKIKSLSDFKEIPLTDKENYILAYPIESLCWDGDLSKGALIAASTGTTGSPTFWPRYAAQDNEAIAIHEKIYRDIFQVDRFSSLSVICFAMGIHIAGYITSTCSQAIGKKGYSVSTISPGTEPESILKCVKEFAGVFGQIIIAGYPPFIKDVIELGIKQGINWDKIKVRFLFAAENFSEGWREYLHEKINVREHDYYSTSINVYGCADAGVLGHETPLSIYIRRACSKDADLEAQIFGETGRNPAFLQYYPLRRFFESVGRELVFSGPTGIPLVRYNIHDEGGIVSYDRVDRLWHERGRSISAAAKSVGAGNFLNSSFLYVFGRTNFGVVFYGANVYPENLKIILANKEVLKFLTGKFVLKTSYKENFDEKLEIKLEIAQGASVGVDFKEWLQKYITENLRKINAEYEVIYSSVGSRAIPELEFCGFGDEKYFKKGVKQKWKT